ncbi:hypothetical protein K32_48310 [Kaistia sp. 32K]|uniref:DNA-binding protein n=1 Tax=Kaistia sp. 32K TaxID=2795690 RepID=UPI00191592CB|nr:DNA-binding protein [Kaistia sp. 32K]BCP56214.1 hypothetical protein K32_48310 [Kaistia sp. 32K]
MQDKKFLTPTELSARWDGRITVRTLANWRSSQSGPRYLKVGGGVLYRITDVIEWENNRTVEGTSQYRR